MLFRRQENRGEERRARWALPGILLAILFTLAVGLASNRDAAANENAHSLAGTWRVSIAITDCATGTLLPLPRNPFPALVTYFKGGEVLESGCPSTFCSAGHGTWERVGPRLFRSHFMFFHFAADGTYFGTQEVRETIRLIASDQAVSDDEVVLRDPDGNVVVSGCARGTASRFQ